MTIAEALASVKEIRISNDASFAVRRSASELARMFSNTVTEFAGKSSTKSEPGVLVLGCASIAAATDLQASIFESNQNPAIYLLLKADGSGVLCASHQYLLFSFVVHLYRDLAEEEICLVQQGRVFETAFAWHRSTYDFFLTQEGRIQKGLNRETYVQTLAKSGFTHIEVNGLGFPEALEDGPKGEAYPMFYTYCPALDQFVSSELNHGLYPSDYL